MLPQAFLARGNEEMLEFLKFYSETEQKVLNIGEQVRGLKITHAPQRH